MYRCWLKFKIKTFVLGKKRYECIDEKQSNKKRFIHFLFHFKKSYQTMFVYMQVARIMCMNAYRENKDRIKVTDSFNDNE